MKAGGEHWQWDNDVPFYVGVLPRRGASGSDVKVSVTNYGILVLHEFDRDSGSVLQTHFLGTR